MPGRRGSGPPGSGERPTLKTIARLAGLAVPTVSRALSDAPDIGSETKERVRALAREIGYRPDRTGLRLRTGKTNVIALAIATGPEVVGQTAYFMTSIASELRGTPYHMIVTPYFLDEDPLDPVRYIVETRSADGLILNRIEPQDRRIDYLRARGFPFAMHGRTADCAGLPWFDFDNAAFARRAVERLAARGRRRVAILTPPLTQSYARHIVEGAAEAGARLGVAVDVVPGTSSDEAAGQVGAALRAHLARAPGTDGIVCPSVASAMAAVVTLEEDGRALGRDIDLAAKESIAMLRSFRREIIAIAEDVTETGAFLARAVMQAIDRPDLPPLQRLIGPAEEPDA